MKNPILEVYSSQWVQVQRSIEQQALLKPLNMNVYHRTSISPHCLSRKIKFEAALVENLALLAVWFAEVKRHPDYVLQGRRMYRQYQQYLIGVKAQIAHVSMWLDQNPPF